MDESEDGLPDVAVTVMSRPKFNGKFDTVAAGFDVVGTGGLVLEVLERSVEVDGKEWRDAFSAERFL